MADNRRTGRESSSARRAGNARQAARRPAGYENAHPAGRSSERPPQSRKDNGQRPAPRQVASTGRRDLVLSKAELRALSNEQREKEWQTGVERVRGGMDKIMLALVILLVTLGAIMVFSASYPTGLAESGDGFKYLKKHLIYAGIGGVAMIAASFVPFRVYKRWGPPVLYGIAFVMLAAVLVIGTSEGEAKRWIYIGSFSVQPSEIMKIALVLILAWYIDKYKDRMKEATGFWEKFRYNTLYPFAFIAVACGMVLLEKHLSGTIILAFLGISVMLIGGCNLKYTLLTSAVGGAAAVGFFIMKNPYALKRLVTFTSEDVDILGEGWQTHQGVLAIGSGGLFGLGFGQSNQKHSYVSMAHNDFIFSIWCEELGFFGALFLIALFVAFVWRGYVISMRAPDTFSTLLVFGAVTQVGLQAFLNMMVVCDIIPNTGISLPFISYGGSSLIMLMAEMGLILSISRHFYRKKTI
ncbi:MAG: cell division protein FtsW [Clostridia bacterium]|nr:cell division protein FtsW [Clostridia bacterium]